MPDRQPVIARHYALAVLTCAGATVLVITLRDVLQPANLVLLYMLVVVAVATWLGRGPAVMASIVGVACFDFFVVPPRHSMSVADAEYLVTLIVMLVVALVITHLTSAYRAKALEAERRAEEARVMHALAAALAGATTTVQVATLLDAHCREAFAGRAWLFEADDAGHLAAVSGAADPPDDEACRFAQAVSWRAQAMTVAASDGSAAVDAYEPLHGATRGRGVLCLRLPRDRAGGSSLPAALAALATTASERIHFTDVAYTTTLAMQTERLRSSILATVAHDLRTPLTVLHGLADALAERPELAADARGLADAMREHSLHMHRTVDNLLDMARLRSGRVELHRDWQSVPELFAASARALAPWLDSQRLRFDWPADLPLLYVDAVLLERVFCNLLENAAKYAPAGTPITVSASCADEEDGRRMTIAVDDEGPGFPPASAERLLQLFEQGAPESATSGFGIGLAVCRAIVEAHGGRLGILDRAIGARVWLSLPIATPPPLDEEGA